MLDKKQFLADIKTCSEDAAAAVEQCRNLPDQAGIDACNQAAREAFGDCVKDAWRQNRKSDTVKPRNRQTKKKPRKR